VATQYDRDEFNARYHTWALGQARLERERGFPHLRSFPTGTAPRFLSFYDQLSAGEKMAVSEALALRWVPDPDRLVGRALTNVDRVLIDRYRAFAKSPASGELERQFGIANGSIPRLRRKLLAKEIRRRLGPLFPEIGENWGGGLWRFARQFQEFHVHTYIDTGGNFHELSYSHCVVHGSPEPLGDHISLFSYLGISSQTMWNYLSERDLGPVADCVEDLVRNFMDSIPTILGVER
jgi:hypothetical protein